MFSNKKRLSKKAYLAFVQQKESLEILDFFVKNNLPSVLGTGDFKAWVRKRFQHLKCNKQISGTGILVPEAAEIKALVCKAYRVKEESFSVSRRGARNLPRDVAIYLLRRFSHETLSIIGQQFCLENYSSVSSANERIKRQLRNDAKLRKEIGNLERILAKGQSRA
jgi:chromosomal replication initiation ATPase DnaA